MYSRVARVCKVKAMRVDGGGQREVGVRGTATEYINAGKIVYSHVGRVCKVKAMRVDGGGQRGSG